MSASVANSSPSFREVSILGGQGSRAWRRDEAVTGRGYFTTPVLHGFDCSRSSTVPAIIFRRLLLHVTGQIIVAGTLAIARRLRSRLSCRLSGSAPVTEQLPRLLIQNAGITAFMRPRRFSLPDATIVLMC